MYLIYSLPRSRTFWLSRYLTYNDWHCSHDEIIHMRSLDDIHSWFKQPNTGSVETSAAPFWRLIQNYQPDIKTVVIRRPVSDVIRSMNQQGFVVNPAVLHRLDRKLDQIEHRIPNVLSIPFVELSSEAACKQLFEHVLPYDHDHDWWQSMDALNLQVNLKQVMRYYQAYQPQFNKLAKIAAHIIVSHMSSSRVTSDRDDGIIFSDDSFDNWYRDSKEALATHVMAIGEAPATEKNFTMMKEMNAIGSMQIISARCNGRVFGYLFSVISPSMESETRMTALNCAFFADPAFPGLGQRLQREALKVLRSKGVDEAFFYAGVRADGPRLGTLYRRMGASNFGQIYKLALNE